MGEGATPADAAEMARFEALGEAAYERMYDARGYEVKACFEDAREYLGEAMRIAEALGRLEDQARLAARREHIRAVYNSQFRGLY